MTTRFVYAVKVWLTAVLLPPLAIMLFNIIPVETLAYLTNVYMIMVIAGAIFSLPGFLLLWLTAYLPENSRFYPANKKMLLSAMALIYIAIVSGWLLDFDFSDRIPLIYALIIIGGIWLCDSMPGAHSRADYPANTQA